ncbi:MAG: hypothetical protein R2757_04735 [Draconibacterium sp.]
MKNKLILFVISFFPFGQVMAQELVNEPPGSNSQDSPIELPLSDLEFTLSILVLIFAFLVLGMVIYLVKVNKIESENSIKIVLITLIITATLFLITAGYSNDQIAPAVGLLGTIAGYLLGKENNKKREQ